MQGLRQYLLQGLRDLFLLRGRLLIVYERFTLLVVFCVLVHLLVLLGDEVERFAGLGCMRQSIIVLLVLFVATLLLRQIIDLNLILYLLFLLIDGRVVLLLIAIGWTINRPDRCQYCLLFELAHSG